MCVVMASAHIPVVLDWRMFVRCRARQCMCGHTGGMVRGGDAGGREGGWEGGSRQYPVRGGERREGGLCREAGDGRGEKR